MIKPFTMEVPTSSPKPSSSNTHMMDFSKLQNMSVFSSQTQEDTSTQEKKKGPGRPRKKTDDNLFTSPAHMSSGEVLTESLSNDSPRELTFLESNEPYENKFQETNAILRSAIMQLDMGLAAIQNDIEEVRSAKTLRNKYNHLSLLQGNMGTFISNKISAARELNNTITKCNEMELKRYKEIKAGAAAEQDDDQRIMDMYKAFISVPANNNTPGYGPLGPSMASMTLSSPNILGNDLGTVDSQYAQYMSNLTPSQNMMMLESNPNVKQVVVYNQETGARYFEVMDLSTGQVVPNAEKHDAMFLEDITIDQKNKVARNINLGETYPLVIVGEPVLNEY